ncbi:MAG: YitT family protein [Bacteroidales bacterium]|nr:YitT family protein [Bacteroidales bacterium]
MNLIRKTLTGSRGDRNKTENIKHSLIVKGKAFPWSRIDILNELRYFMFIILGALSASFGLGGFLLPNSFIDGGVMGISLITTELTGISLSLLIVIINLPFLVMGFSSISKQFAIRSLFAIILLALAVHIIPFPSVTDDNLLISVFGGFFLGLGIGLAIRGGSVIDGTEVAAIYFNKHSTLTIGDVILIFNIIIFSFAAVVFSVETALYAILTYFTASKTVDFVVSGIEEYTGVTIISDKSEEIRVSIIENMGRGCTIYKGEKGFAPGGEVLKPVNIIYTLITRLELTKLQTEIDKIDSSAFIIMHSVNDAKGGMIKKRPLK